jgi:hypothetical protein
MKFATLQPGEDLAKLTKRLYPTRSRNVLKAAQEALLRANPHLSDPKTAPRGAPVVVPKIAEAEPAAAEVGADKDLVASLLEQARQELGDIRPALEARLQRQEETTKAALARAGTAELRRLAEKEPELKKRLDVITANARTQLEQIQSLRTLQKDAVTELEKDLDAFLGVTTAGREH